MLMTVFFIHTDIMKASMSQQVSFDYCCSHSFFPSHFVSVIVFVTAARGIICCTLYSRRY